LINRDMARDYLERSLRCLKECKSAYADGDYAGTVRRGQEALELAVKSILRALGIEYPREHDVSDVMLAEKSRMPEEVSRDLEELAALVRELASLRGPATYGLEREGIPASRIFEEGYAREVVEKVDRYVESIRSVLVKVL